MDNQKQYEEMLKSEQSSCEITFAPKKKTTRKKSVKDRVLTASNKKLKVMTKDEPKKSEVAKYNFHSEEKENKPAKNKRFNLKIDIIQAQIAVIFALVLTILLTNIFWEDSGMNVLFREVFGTSAEKTENKLYTDFTVYAPSSVEDTASCEGVMTFSTAGAVYAPCQGVVKEIVKNENSLYNVTISHSDSFSSVIENVDYVYYGIGEEVFRTTPIGLALGENEINLKLFNGENLIKGYAVSDGVITWEE